jgi:hypothetical protein
VLCLQPLRGLRRALLPGLVLVTFGCENKSEAPRPQPFSEHHFAAYSGASPKGIGEDCTASGAAECKSGICLHTGGLPNTGYVCSSSCSSPTECPAGWNCARGGLEASQALCVPARAPKKGG